MNVEDRLRLFHMRFALLNNDLKAVERRYSLELVDSSDAEGRHEDAYYLQFSAAIRSEAAVMAQHYELFYCLENSMRELVSAQLLSTFGEDWWNVAVPPVVNDNVQKNLQREREAGITVRSNDLIDYTTFGELGEIIQHNWEAFADTFNNRKALAKILTGLNLLRAPIAHCSPLATDEVTRLELSLRDWFRVME